MMLSRLQAEAVASAGVSSDVAQFVARDLALDMSRLFVGGGAAARRALLLHTLPRLPVASRGIFWLLLATTFQCCCWSMLPGTWSTDTSCWPPSGAARQAVLPGKAYFTASCCVVGGSLHVE